MKEELKRAFQESHSFQNEDQELAAIWLKNPVMTLTGRSQRIEAGDFVCIHEGRLIDLCEKPSHVVEACTGTVSSNFKLHVRDLITGEKGVIEL